MCGIAGTMGCASREDLSRMVQTIRHRGPDNQESVWFPELRSGLGHARLSIIDPTPAGNQPMKSPDGRFWIVCSGELFNYEEIAALLGQHGYRFHTQSDTEVILNSFLEWGIDAVDRFIGMYALAVLDRESGRLVLMRDRLGVKPLYYAVRNTGLVFSSEIKGILASRVVAASPDVESLCSPTRYQVAPYTGFDGIRKLPPGHYLTWDRGVTEVHPYWRLVPSESPVGNEAEAEEALEGLLTRSVELHSRSDVPVGVLLSGGLDSTLVAALASKSKTLPVHSFFANPGNNGERHAKSDQSFARDAAARFNLRHHEIQVSPEQVGLLPQVMWHLDEPLADPAAISVFLLAGLSRSNGIPVLLSGMGGDEIFGGYRKYLACLHADLYQGVFPRSVRTTLEHYIPGLMTRTGVSGRKSRWASRFLSFASLPRLERYLCSDLSLTPDDFDMLVKGTAGYRSTPYFQKHRGDFSAGSSYLSSMCLADTLNFLPEHNFLYTEKAAMAQGVEDRPPLASHEVVEFVFGLPDHFRIKHLTQKYLFKQVARKFLPGSFVDRPKQPFGSPVRSWLSGPLRGMVDDLLSENAIKKRGLFNPRSVQLILHAHNEGQADHSLTLWMLLSTEIWFQTFIDRPVGQTGAEHQIRVTEVGRKGEGVVQR